MIKKINLPLIIGGILILILTLIAFFPSYITDKSPYTIQQMRFIHDGGSLDIQKAPYAPSVHNIMGTDDFGRDIWSYIAFGTRTTLGLGILAALSQFFIAIPLALLAGAGHRGIKAFCTNTSGFFAAFPALLMSILILQINFFSGLNRLQSTLVFVAVITLVGWSKLSVLLTQRTEQIYSQNFIMGAIAIGKSKSSVAFENVLPHLIPEIVVLFFMEIARNLALMMQLGLFGVFIGNLRVILDSQNGIFTYYNISFEPEWASMLSTSRTFLTVAPWTVLFPALAFFVSVLAFNLFAEGLRLNLQQQNKLIEWPPKNIKKSKAIRILLACSLIVIILPFINTEPEFNLEGDLNLNASSQTQAAISPLIVGTDQVRPALQELTSIMKDLNMTLETSSFDIPKGYLIKDQALTIETNKNATTYKGGLDFNFLSGRPDESNAIVCTGSIYDARLVDLYTIKSLNDFDHKVIILSDQYYSNEFIQSFIQKHSQDPKTTIKGFLIESSNNYKLLNPLALSQTQVPVIQVTSDFVERILSDTNPILKARATITPIEGQGKNLIGIFRSNEQDPILSNEYIAIGMSYNYVNQSQKKAVDFNVELMKNLCASEGNRRSLIFIFFDGTLSDDFHGLHFFSNHLIKDIDAKDIKVFLDLTGLGYTSGLDESPLLFSSAQAPISRQFAWNMGQMVTREFEKRGVDFDELTTIKRGQEYKFPHFEARNAMFWNAGVASLVLEGDVNDWEQLGKILVSVIKKNNY